jgi:zinc protease
MNMTGYGPGGSEPGENASRSNTRKYARCGRISPGSLLKLFCLFLLFSAAFLLPASDVRTADESAGQDQEVLRATLDNGLRVVIVRNTLAPVATTVMSYLVGSNETPPGFPGTAHALEHMMFRGTPELSAGQLANITASLGGMFNAMTTQNASLYFFTVPSEDLDVALRIEAIRMRGILDSRELWSQERGAIEQEVAQDLSIPEYVFYIKLLEAMFKGTPYAHDPLGTRASFAKTTSAMLKQFHETWYVPNNAILVIVGNVQPQEALARVRSLFGSIPAKKLPPRPKVRLQPVRPETIRLTTDKPYGMVITSFRMPGYDSPDYAAAQVLADILSSRRGSLYALVLQGKALDTDFEIDSFTKAGLGYAIAAFPQGADAQSLQKDIRSILGSTKKGGISADMVEAAKRRKVTETEFEKNSVAGLAMSWSQALAVEGRNSPEDDVNAIRKVTVEDVERVARKYLDLDHSIAAVLTPQPSGNPVSGKGFGGKESFTPKQIKPVRLPDWAEKSLRRLTIPSSTLHPVVDVLPNGIRLIVQSAPGSNTVSVYGRIRNKPEMEEPAGKEGVDGVLENLFSFGTASLDRDSFLKALDDIGAVESAGKDFSLQVLADRFDRGMQLLADNELNPALPAQAFEVVRTQAAAEAAGRLKSSEYLAERALKKALFPENDPSLRQATPATISSLTLEDVKDYYRKVFRPDLTTIVVAGNITPERAREAVMKYFGGWKAPEDPKPEVLLPPVPLNKPSYTTVPNASRIQDRVTLAQTLGLTRSDPDYHPLRLGNTVLGGSFYATRLYRDLREYAGLVYYVSSSFQMSKTRGIYVTEYACDPPNVSKARAIILKNLRDMQNTLVGTEELDRAKALLLREIPLSESSIDDIASGFLRRVELDLPLDEPIRAAGIYLKLGAPEVREAFRKWLRTDDLVQVTEGPSPR